MLFFSRRISFLILFLAFFIHLQAQEGKKEIGIGTIEQLYSEVLEEEREIWVHVPKLDKETYAEQRFPVVYLLDGAAHFYSMVGMMHQLSSVNGNTLCPKMIIVGIPNTDRTRDLTPTFVKNAIYLEAEQTKNSGGGEAFTEFLRTELMPYIDQHYPTAPYRLLVGHSFGGLLAMHILLNHKDLFNGYLAIDPSLWWDREKLVKDFREVAEEGAFLGKQLFLAMANTLEPGQDTSSLRRDYSMMSTHARCIIEMTDALTKNDRTGLRWDWKFYKEETHQSVPLIATYDAFRFLFKAYQLPELRLLARPGLDILPYIKEHYKKASSMMGYDMLPPEQEIDGLGSIFEGLGMPERAESLYQMNVKNYPTSVSAHERLGDFYRKREKIDRAKDFYAKALSIKEVAAIREKMNDLEK